MHYPIKNVYEDVESLALGFTVLFENLISGKSGNINVSLSGGSTPKLWFEYLTIHKRSDIEWNRLHFFWGDERCVPPDHADSNYGMTRKYLLDHIKIPEKNIHRIKGELNPAMAALTYSQELLDHFTGAVVPRFDLIILGLGEDGHTASIFPHEIELWNSDSLCVVASHPESAQKRVSLSGKVINHAQSVVFLVTGDNKSNKVAEIIDKEPGASKYPASHVNPADGQLYWFMDVKAASKLIL